MNAPTIPAGKLGRAGTAALGVIALAIFGIYARSIGSPFLFDDAPAIERNISIRVLWPPNIPLTPPLNAAGAAGRPIVNLSLAIDYALGGLDPKIFHFTNVLLHVLAGFAVFGLIRRILLLPSVDPKYTRDATSIAFCIALLWSCHGLLSESVVCVIQRNEILVGLFYLVTIYCFVRGVSAIAPRRWFALSVISCAIGMATKEVMATAPLMVLLVDRTFVAGTFASAFRLRWRFYLALASTWIVLGALVYQYNQRDGIVGFGLGVSSWTYLLTQCQAIGTYLRLSLFPYPLVLDYGVNFANGIGSVLGCGLVVLLLFSLTFYGLARRPRLGLLGAWFFVVLAPSSSFLPLTTQPIAEHRMYLPLLAVVTLCVACAWEIMGRRAIWVAGGVALALGAATAARVRDYRSEESIWRDTIAKAPDNARAFASLGGVLARTARLSEAQDAYESAISLRPDYADAQSDLGTVLLAAGETAEALRHYELAHKLKPDDNQILFNLAVALGRAERRTEAMSAYETVAQREPRNAGAWNNLGDLRLKSGNPDGALAAFTRAAEIDPNAAATLNNLGMVETRLGRTADAIRHLEKASLLDAKNVEIRSNLGAALLGAGRRDDALGEYQAAAHLAPEGPGIHYNLANVLLDQGRLEEAAKEFEAEIRLQPNFAPAHHNLGLTLSRLGRFAAAVTEFEIALQQLPKNAVAHFNLAVALASLGRIDEAIAQDDEALSLQPDFPQVRRHREQLLRNR